MQPHPLPLPRLRQSVWVSMAGGVFHNVGQILVAYFVTKTAGVAFYLPVLLVAGLVTGLLIGLLAKEVLKHIGKESVDK